MRRRWAALVAISTVGVSACAGDQCCPCAAEATYAADLAAVYELDQSGPAGAQFFLAAVRLDDCLSDAVGYSDGDKKPVSANMSDGKALGGDGVLNLAARLQTLEEEIGRLEERDANLACAVWGVAQAFHVSHATGGTGAHGHDDYFSDSAIWSRRYDRIVEACSGDEQMRMLEESAVVLEDQEMPPQ